MTGVILAYDSSEFKEKGVALLKAVHPYIDLVKLGLQAMTAETLYGITTVAIEARTHAWRHGKKTMLDLKINDIGNTVSKTLANIVAMQPPIAMTTLHATVSDSALRAAAKACGENVLPLAVTVLTDLSEEECVSRFGDKPNETVLRFAKNARRQGIRGLVCSAQELSYLRRHGALEGITTVIPGTRSEGVTKHDQMRVMTPAEAAKAGADYVVIGREITEAPDPGAAAKRIRDALDEVGAAV